MFAATPDFNVSGKLLVVPLSEQPEPDAFQYRA